MATIDDEPAWRYFYYWLNGYCTIASACLQRERHRGQDPTIYDGVADLLKRARS
jgi:hypothetical protein